MRSAQIERETAETQIAVSLNIDGSGTFGGTTGIGFFDHMMNLLACHSGMDITLHVHGDLDVDTHHTIEDLAIVFGDALTRALGSLRKQSGEALAAQRYQKFRAMGDPAGKKERA